jgi:hypothetical protein
MTIEEARTRLAHEIVQRAIQMRLDQRAYFRTRSQQVLRRAKESERKLDDLIAQYESMTGQLAMFPDEEAV